MPLPRKHATRVRGGAARTTACATSRGPEATKFNARWSTVNVPSTCARRYQTMRHIDGALIVSSPWPSAPRRLQPGKRHRPRTADPLQGLADEISTLLPSISRAFLAREGWMNQLGAVATDAASMTDPCGHPRQE